MSHSRSRSQSGHAPYLQTSSFGRNQSNSQETSFSSQHLPAGTTSNEAIAIIRARQSQQDMYGDGPSRQVKEIQQRGHSPLIPATQVDMSRRNGRSILSPPAGNASTSNSLQVPGGGRHRSASPAGGSALPRERSRSPNLPPAMSPPPANGYQSFSLGLTDTSTHRALPVPSPGGDSSYSFEKEEDLYRTRKRKSMKRDDDAAYRRGDDDYSEDSDDNPDPTVGIAARNGALRHRRRTSTADLHDANPLRPRNGKGRATTMSAVPEDEGIEDEGFGQVDEGLGQEDEGVGLEDVADKDDYADHPATYTSPAPQRIIVATETTLPRAYRQPKRWEHALRNLQQQCRHWLATLRKHPAAILIAVLAVMWMVYISYPGAKSSTVVAPVPLPGNFDELAGRLGGLETSHTKGTAQLNQLGQRLARLEAEQSVLSELKQQQAAVLADNRRTRDQMGATIGRVDKLERRVDSLEGLVSQAINDGSLRDALGKILPAVMPVRRAKDGGWDIDDSFFAVFMKRVLYGTGSLEQEIRHLVNQGVETEAKRWSEDWQGDSKRLTERIEQMLSSHTAEILISREDFVQLLEERTQELWREIRSVQENTESLPTAIKLKTSKGEDVTAMLQGIVDASLLRYSNDKLGLVDYALYSAGARVIEETTTPTLQLTDEPSFIGRLWGEKAVYARPPHIALHPDTTVGQCWAFGGPAGDLGVLLSRPDVIVSSITIDHIAKSVTTDISSAPKDIEVWVTVEGEENRVKARQYLEESPLRDEPTSMPQTEENILLAKVVYDINSATPTQTFPVPKEFVDLGISTRITTFRVLSNWGGDVTCIYRVRVHGSTKEASPPGSEL
ncbi:uncharacterized protein CcaverHIS019_0203130 [Cutaneotrichosporon cavernicola]|uniref:SUN domain-containing protein n=1 Tax=Cutaneotrichosporon cavernicola TaxID=279322 RepID=A0AA48IDE3_9TREE|nr:uncharacterized protein CcaverHIS019_0203130 [Cutaneotrichosporon cavernicola]BEI88951.1 hypothetical protein CcaverHIS019_0203130 [Cutaneotrichosporon cavernicola]